MKEFGNTPNEGIDGTRGSRKYGNWNKEEKSGVRESGVRKS